MRRVRASLAKAVNTGQEMRTGLMVVMHSGCHSRGGVEGDPSAAGISRVVITATVATTAAAVVVYDRNQAQTAEKPVLVTVSGRARLTLALRTHGKT